MRVSPEAKVEAFKAFAIDKLEEIREALKGDPLMTLIVRYDGKPESDILITLDSFDGLMELLARRRAAEGE